MNRKEIKKKAKKSLKRNYLITILLVFIVGLIVGGGYKFTTSKTGTNTSTTNVEKSNYELIKKWRFYANLTGFYEELCLKYPEQEKRIKREYSLAEAKERG